MTGDKFNGWTNYATWCVHLWLTNEQATDCYWRDQAAQYVRDAPDSEMVREGIWKVADAARYQLADQMQEEFADAVPLTEPTVFSDLLLSALGSVNWSEIAAAFLDDIDEAD